jgi:hypothetical protein
MKPKYGSSKRYCILSPQLKAKILIKILILIEY